MGTKSANLYARIEPEVKEQAEKILSALGIPTAGPVNAAELSETELSAELEKGYADMLSGRTKPAKQVFADIRRDYKI